jgi:hypothetical protein
MKAMLEPKIAAVRIHPPCSVETDAESIPDPTWGESPGYLKLAPVTNLTKTPVVQMLHAFVTLVYRLQTFVNPVIVN